MIDGWLRAKAGIGFYEYLKQTPPTAQPGSLFWQRLTGQPPAAPSKYERSLVDMWERIFEGLSVTHRENIRGLISETADFITVVQVYFACDKNMASARQTLASLGSV
jgi:hypothetical protein